MLLLPSFETARSSFPSPLKSPVATHSGDDRVVTSILPSAIEEVESEIGKNTMLDVPPPGLGLTTATLAVLAVAMSAAGTVAVNCEPLTKVVASAFPFQLTTEPETK